ncbi:MAG: type II CAAX endopeptidase family protein [Gracilimonas sp.]
MTNPFFNSEEQRLRSLFRILLFIFLFALAVGIPFLIPIEPLQYIGQSIMALGLFYVMFRFVDQRPWSAAGLTINITWIKECLAGIVIAAFVMGLIFLTLWQTNGLEITGFGWERNGTEYWLIPLSLFLLQMMSVGFYEEVMARGYLIPNITEGFTFGNITPQKATVIAIIISSSIFGILHASNPNASITAVVNIIFAGVMLAVPFVITGRLALPIGLHFAWNFFQGGVFGFRVSGMEFRSSVIQIQQDGPDWWTGGAFGPEAGLIGILGILLILGLSVLYLKKTGVKLTLSETLSASFNNTVPQASQVKK